MRILKTSNNYKKFTIELLVFSIEKLFSPFLAAIRKSYSTHADKNDGRIEGKLRQQFPCVRAVLTDLPKAIESIPHNFLIANLSAYRLSSDSLSYIYSYIKDRKQCLQINNKQIEIHKC